MGIQSFATFLDSHLRGNDTKEQNVNLFKTFTIATQCSRISNKKSLPLDGGGQVGVKDKNNHPPLTPPIVRLSSRRSQGRGMSVIHVVAKILILINARSISLSNFKINERG